MAAPTTTASFSGNQNYGAQIAYNYGHIEIHDHHQLPERPETPPQPSCFVPFRRDPDFMDHAALLDRIRQKISVPAARVALVGLGGVGKSQLAIEYCYRTLEQSPSTWIFWVHASNMDRLDQSLRQLADQAKIRGHRDPQADVFKLVHGWLRDEKNGPWLLVVDNADDDAFLRQNLSKFLPVSRHGSVLVTSRARHAASQIVEANEIIFVEPMSGEVANALLCRKLGDEIDQTDGLTELAAVLDHMPLALVQAASYIRQRAPRCSVQQYLEEYSRNDSHKASLLKHGAGHLRRDEVASNSVLFTWQISFEYIKSKRRSAADLLSLMSFFERQGIPEYVLRSQKNSMIDDSFEDDVLILRDFSFLTVTTDVHTFEMHSLVQLAMRKWLENQGEAEMWRTQFIACLCAELPSGDYRNWGKCQVLFPHAVVALAQGRPHDKESLKKWAQLLCQAAWYAWQRGRVHEAVDMSTISMEVNKEVCGENAIETLDSMGMVALAKEIDGDANGAEALHRQILAQYEKTLGIKDCPTLVCRNHLARVLEVQYKYTEAEEMGRETLVLWQEVLGPDHQGTLMAMSNLASVLRMLDKLEEAELLTREVLARREELFGPDHPLTLIGKNRLADILYDQGKAEESAKMNKDLLARYNSVFGPEHLSTLRMKNKLATMLCDEGKYEEAEMCYRQTLAQYNQLLRPKHPVILSAMSKLAFALGKQGKDDEAEAINRQTLADRKNVLGPEHPLTLASMGDLAMTLARQGKYEEAEVMNKQILPLREKVLGPEHPETFMTIYFLAHLAARQNRFDEARNLYRTVYASCRTVLGEEHPTTQACYEYCETAKRNLTEEQPMPSASSETRDRDSRKRGQFHRIWARGLEKLRRGDPKPSV